MTLQTKIANILNSQQASVSFEGHRYRMSDLRTRVFLIGSWLLTHNDSELPVAICLPNSPELMCWHMAAFLTDTKFAPIIYEEPDDFLHKAISLTQARFLVISNERAQKFNVQPVTSTEIHVVDVDQENQRTRTNPDGIIDLDNLIRAAQSNALALIIFSSGTSGSMKGIMHSQASTLAFIENLASVLTARTHMTYLVAQPMGHIGGIVTSLLTLLFDGTIALLRQFKTSSYLLALKEHKPSHINLHTPLFYEIVDTPNLDRAGFKNIECCFAAGDNLAADLPRRFTALTGAPMRTGYGMTEIGIVTVNAHPYDTHAGSVGYRVEPMSIEIRSKDNSVAQTNQTGEIWVKSPVQCLGYWQSDHLNAATICGDWFRTGDAGYVNADGEYWYVGRVSTAIEVNGNSIYPSRMELALYDVPIVTKACVVSVHQCGKTIPVVYVELSLEAKSTMKSEDLVIEKLRHELIEKVDASFARIDIRIITDMPLNMTGKIDRAALAERAKN